MDTDRSYDAWQGRDVYGTDGKKIGSVDDIFYDDQTRRPEWVAIKTGKLGGRRLAPLAGAMLSEDSDELRLGFDEARIKDAPKIDIDDHLTADQERELYSYYGFDWAGQDQTSNFGYGEHYGTGRFDDKWANRWDEHSRLDQQGEVVAEETVRNEKAKVVEDRQPVRLRKYRWTEQVPVEHEEVRLEKGGTTTQTQSQSRSR